MSTESQAKSLPKSEASPSLLRCLVTWQRFEQRVEQRVDGARAERASAVP